MAEEKKKVKSKEKKGLEETIQIPEGVEVSLNSVLVIKGPKGELKRFFKSSIKIEISGKTIILSAERARKAEKKMFYTIKSHIQNMFHGVMEGFTYELEICAVHFPMTVNIDNERKIIVIKNFLGERVERTSKILPNVDVKKEGDHIIVSSCDKEAAGQTAANLEVATKIKEKDSRVFQDGIWILSKPKKLSKLTK